MLAWHYRGNAQYAASAEFMVIVQKRQTKKTQKYKILIQNFIESVAGL